MIDPFALRMGVAKKREVVWQSFGVSRALSENMGGINTVSPSKALWIKPAFFIATV